MYNDITTFFREMPLAYYLAGGFWSAKEPTLAFFIGNEQIEALVAGRRGGVGYESSLEKDNDAPPFANGQLNQPTAKPTRTLSRKLTSRYRLRRNVKHLFIVDAEKKDRFFAVDTLERSKKCRRGSGGNARKSATDLRQLAGSGPFSLGHRQSGNQPWTRGWSPH
jgi:hypothetical protein